MQFLKLRPFEAPSTFTFKDPDTGLIFKAKNKSELFKEIITYRHNNDLAPIEALSIVFENYICGLPENNGKCQKNTEINRGLFPYIQGGIALLKNMCFPQYALQKEAEERADQCKSCPYNIFPRDKGFFAFTNQVAVASIGDRKVKEDHKLGICGVCDCPLKAKVFWGKELPVFPKEQEEKLKEVGCWQLKLSNQEKKDV